MFGGEATDAVHGVLAPDDARAAILTEETGGGDLPLAVTSLERIAACPFAGFAQQVLGVREPPDTGDTPDARAQGILKHGALAEAFRATADLWRARPRDADEIRARAMEAVDAFLNAAGTASAMRRLALERARGDVVAVLEWSLTDDAWDFDAAEAWFGDPRRDGWPPLVLEDGGARLALRGSIDRVDRAHGRPAVRALDYKSSAATAKSSGRALGETTFQVALYAIAAMRAHGVSESDGMYVPVRAGALDGFDPDSKERDAWKNAFARDGDRTNIERRALDLVRAVRAGNVAPHPKDDSVCRGCAYDGGCRKPRFAIPSDDEGTE
jgi:RecB family exonuclease